MKLLTKKISSKIPNLYEQEGKGENAVAYVKFFLPGTRWTWYVTEFNTKDVFFGWVESGISPDFDELGYFSLSDLIEVNAERDLYFEPKPLKEIIENNG
jgi:hypothetical protein